MESLGGGSVFLTKAVLGGTSSGAFARHLPDVFKKKKKNTTTPISFCHYRVSKLTQSPLNNTSSASFLSLRNQLLPAAPPPSCLPAQVEVHTDTIGSSTEETVKPSSEETVNSLAEEITDPSTEETVKSPTEQGDQLSTAHVKFVLKKECSYGEQFLLVGDDPVLGEWNPSAALPLTWSEGHIWTTELDLPIDKLFKFKYILKDATGKIKWQPDPNREFQTYETADTITVSEEWETAEEEQDVPKDDEQQQPLTVEQDIPVEPEPEPEPVMAVEGTDQHAEKQKQKPDSPTEGSSSIEEEQTPVLAPGLTAETSPNSGADNKDVDDDADINNQEQPVHEFEAVKLWKDGLNTAGVPRSDGDGDGDSQFALSYVLRLGFEAFSRFFLSLGFFVLGLTEAGD